MMNGLLMTILISIGTIFLSMIFGTILALLRHFCTGKWAWLSGADGRLHRIFPLYAQYSVDSLDPLHHQGQSPGAGDLRLHAVYHRCDGRDHPRRLNGIPKGQFESAASQGFSFFQTLFYIVLPQTYKSIIPAMLSQVITVIKDTSFLKVVDIAEFMRNSYVVMGKLSAPSHIIMLYSFIALCYFIICFSLSCGVRYYQKKVLSAART